MKRRVFVLSALLGVAACTEDQGADRSTCTALEPAIGAVSGFRPELVYAAAGPDGLAEVAALEGGLDPGDALSVEPGSEGRVEVHVGERPGLLYRVRDPQRARAEAVCGPIEGGAGATPNDLIIAGPPERPYGVLVRSGDNAVNAFDLQTGLEAGLPGVRLPETDTRCGRTAANPWFAAAVAADRVAVTAYGQGRAYLLDLQRGAIERELLPPAVLSLPAPVPIARALDADCDGTTETTVAQLAPRTPQPIAVTADGTIAAGFTNFLSARPPVYLPGLLAAWSATDPAAPTRTWWLPALNPQELRALDGERLLVVCTGALEQDQTIIEATTPGAVVIFDLSSGTVEQHFDLGDFAPGTALIAGGTLWVGSLATPRLRRLDLTTGALLDELTVNTEQVDSIFRLVELPGGLIGVPSFNTDQLHILDPRTGELHPPPFYGALELGPGRPLFDGLSIIARRPGRAGVDFVGPDLFALSAIASRVRPIELRKVLGP